MSDSLAKSPRDDHPLLMADEIPWQIHPPARRARMPRRLLEALSFDELLAFTEDLQDDLEAVRITLHEALTLMHQMTLQTERDRIRIATLMAQLRQNRRED